MKLSAPSRGLVALTILLLIASAAYTAAIMFVDVRPIGPNGSEVGLATINGLVFDKLGVHAAFDRVGDGVLLLAILTCIVFAVIAVVQLVRYHSIDRSLLWMFVMYLLVAAIYVAFNFFEVNYRPTLDEGMLEASFPSSHVMAVCLVMGTAAIAVHDLVESHGVFVLVTLVAIVAMLAIMATRLLAGVHWFTDVTAGFLFAMVLVSLYGTIMSRKPVVTGKHAR